MDDRRCIAFGGTSVDEAIALARGIARGETRSGGSGQCWQANRKLASKTTLEALRRDLQAARYAAQRAQKQYDAADPENRLVTENRPSNNELERRWNQSLQRVQELELRIEQHTHTHHTNTTSPTREQFEDLATELETVWNSCEADVRLKKRVVRALIHEVAVDVDPDAGEVMLTIHWKGGVHTELRLPRRCRGQNSSQTSKEAIDAVSVLARICSDDLIASELNRNRFQTGRGNRWTRQRVTSLRNDHAIPCYTIERRKSEGWLNLTEAANSLGVSPRTLRLAVERGEIEAEHPLPDGPWVLNRRALETETARRFVERVRRGNRYHAIPAAEQDGFDFSTT
jgi:hypothetical protein